MIYVPSKPAESVVVQENQFPRHIEAEPGVISHRFSLSLFARRYLDRVELRYSFLILDASLNLSELNQRLLGYGDLSDSIDEIASLLNLTKNYPAEPEILDTYLVIEDEEYQARVYDFTKFFSSSASSHTAQETLTAHLVLFGDDGRVVSYYKGISDLVDEAGTGLKLECITVLRAPDKDMYYAGGFTDEEDVKPIEERPAMGVVRFDDVSRASTLGIICDARHKEGKADCLQLIRIYVNGKIDQVVPNPVTISG